MHSPTIFLSGSSSGLSYNDVMPWRIDAQIHLEAKGCTVIDPLRTDIPIDDPGQIIKSPVHGNLDAFVKNIEQGVLASDVIIMGFSALAKEEIQSIECCFVSGLAYAYGIPVIVYVEEDVELDYYIQTPCWFRDHDLEHICQIAADVYVEHEPLTFEEALGQRLHVQRNVMVIRHRKYGPENIRILGMHGLLTRMEDKRARIRHDHEDCRLFDCDLEKQNFDFVRYTAEIGAEEGALDAWVDLGNYGGIIGPLYLTKRWGLPLIEDTVEDSK